MAACCLQISLASRSTMAEGFFRCQAAAESKARIVFLPVILMRRVKDVFRFINTSFCTRNFHRDPRLKLVQMLPGIYGPVCQNCPASRERICARTISGSCPQLRMPAPAVALNCRIRSADIGRHGTSKTESDVEAVAENFAVYWRGRDHQPRAFLGAHRPELTPRQALWHGYGRRDGMGISGPR